jgi:WD40 repeat protein
VPNRDSSSVTIVRASTGDVVATLTGNGLSNPVSAAFDGSRVLVAGDGATVSLWNGQDLSPIGNSMTLPYGVAAAASDGINFWLTLSDFSSTGGLGRY